MLKQRFQSCPENGCVFVGESAQVGEALQLDVHVAGDASLAGRGGRHQVALPEGGLHLCELLRTEATAIAEVLWTDEAGSFAGTDASGGVYGTGARLRGRSALFFSSRLLVAAGNAL
jgi:hypothetical protein